MNTTKKLITAAVLSAGASLATAGDDFTLCYSHYTGWEPVAYAGEYGVLDRWAKREGINIKVITTSEIKISVLIDRKYMELAVQALHDAFELEKA